MDALELLLTRNSAPKLTEPAPEGEVLDNLLLAAMRAPDHARLKPWRFLLVKDTRRQALGDIFARALASRNPDATEADQDKARAKALRAPLIVIVIANIQQHPKVPAIEQRLSAGCAAHSILLGAHAQGFAGIWRTGANAFDRRVMDDLGLAVNEEIVGFLYLGTIEGNYKPIAQPVISDYVQEWSN